MYALSPTIILYIPGVLPDTIVGGVTEFIPVNITLTSIPLELGEMLSGLVIVTVAVADDDLRAGEIVFA